MKKNNEISELYNYSEKINKQITKIIVLLVNVQGYSDDIGIQLEDAIDIEKFTEQEYNDILNSIKELKMNYIVYFNELKFMSDILNKKLDQQDIIVFNFARNGLKEGKKSLIPAFCNLLKIPYTGSGSFVQSLCRNKFVYNKFLSQLNVNCPKTYAYLPNKNWIGTKPPTNNLKKIIIKPIAESGSIGISENIYNYKDFNYDELSFINNQTMIIQEFIEGKEIECPFFVWKEQVIALPPVEILINNNTFLDANSSAKNDYTFSLFESNCPNRFQKILNKIVPALGISCYGRADFRINDKGEEFLFDIATMPFICKHSSFTYAMQKMNYKQSDIFKIILSLTIEKFI